MDRSSYFNRQLVDEGDLNNTESTKIQQLQDRSQLFLDFSGNSQYSSYSVFRGGVYGSPAEYSLNKNLKVTKVGDLDITIASGSALTSVGELITVTGSLTLSAVSSSSVYGWPSSADGTYFVKIEYQESSGGIKQNDVGVEFPTQYTSTYFLNVNTTVPVQNEIVLASFPISTNVIGTVTDYRTYIRFIVPGSGVSFDPTVNPITSVSTVQAHILAKGTGTSAVTNIHALAPEDIGAQPASSLSLFSSVSIGSQLLGKVYRNTQGKMYLEVNTIIDQTSNPQPGITNSFSLYTSISGSTAGTGSLSGTIFEVSRFSTNFRQANIADVSYFRDALKAIIPLNWYYKVAATNEFVSTTTGSVGYTSVYL